jgi:hypothetical protein
MFPPICQEGAIIVDGLGEWPVVILPSQAKSDAFIIDADYRGFKRSPVGIRPSARVLSVCLKRKDGQC